MKFLSNCLLEDLKQYWSRDRFDDSNAYPDQLAQAVPFVQGDLSRIGDPAIRKEVPYEFLRLCLDSGQFPL